MVAGGVKDGLHSGLPASHFFFFFFFFFFKKKKKKKKKKNFFFFFFFFFNHELNIDELNEVPGGLIKIKPVRSSDRDRSDLPDQPVSVPDSVIPLGPLRCRLRSYQTGKRPPSGVASFWFSDDDYASVRISAAPRNPIAST